MSQFAFLPAVSGDRRMCGIDELQRPDGQVHAEENAGGTDKVAGRYLIEAKDGPAALQLLDREPIDLSFADVGLPSMNGRDLAAKVRQVLDRPL